MKGLVNEYDLIVYLNDNIELNENECLIGKDKEQLRDRRYNSFNSSVIEIPYGMYITEFSHKFIDGDFEIGNTKVYNNYLQTFKDKVKKNIDINTRERIMLIANEDKQRTLLAMYNYLLEKKIDGNINDDESLEMQKLKIFWQEIETIRQLGNFKEGEVDKCETFEDLVEDFGEII